MNRSHIRLIRHMAPESAARMRHRLRSGAFLRGIFWQGLHGADSPDVAPEVRRYLDDDQFNQLTKREEVCYLQKVNPWCMSFRGLLEKLKVAAITPTRLSLR